MEKYLIDNNVIANYTSEKFSKNAMNFLANVIDEIPNISVITKIEALSWHSAIIQEEDSVKLFVNSSNIIALSDSIVEKCIEIRRNCKIKTPDAIIAATVIVNDFTLLTSDSDFNRIPNLKIINPFDW
jgi:predicted nucleic acid-binding protein